MISFGYPLLFWILTPLLGVFAFLVLTNKSLIERVFATEVLAKLRVSSALMPRRVREGIFFGALFLMVVAMSRPYIPQGEQKSEIGGLSVVVALDISGSMRSQDLYPNRLAFGKQKILDLLEELKYDEVGLGAFASQAFIIAPLSHDKATLSQMLKQIDDKSITLDSTDFSTLPAIASRLLEQRSPKILIVVTDGGDKQALSGLAKGLKKEDITLFSLVVGTTQGAPVLDRHHKPLLLADGSIAVTKRSDEIIDIAKQTNGNGVVATHGKSDIKAIVDSMRHLAQDKKEVKFEQAKELFYYPLALALVLLLVSFSSLPRMRR